MIKISKSVCRAMLDAAQNSPEEICGLLGGSVSDGVTTVSEVYFTENTYHSPTRYSMNVKEQLAAVKDIRGKGLQTVGSFHSHIDGEAIPSNEDIRLAYDDGIYYFIISRDVRAFCIKNGEVFEEELVIE